VLASAQVIDAEVEMKRFALAAGLIAVALLVGTVTWQATKADGLPAPRLVGAPCAYPSQDLEAFSIGASEGSLRSYFGGTSFKPSTEPPDAQRGSCLVFACMPSPGSDASNAEQVVFLVKSGMVSRKWLVSSRANLPADCPTEGRELIFAGTQPRVTFPVHTPSTE